MKAFYFEGSSGDKMTEAEIPDDMKDKAQEYRQILLEKLADENEEMMEKLLEEQEIRSEEIK